jgi:flagellin-like protein
MKGISAVIASILMLMITIAVSGTAYLYVSGYFTSKSSVLLALDVLSACRGDNMIVSVRNDGTGVAVNVNIAITYPDEKTTSQCSIDQINAGSTNSTVCPLSNVIIGSYQVRASGGGSVASGSVYCSSGIPTGAGSTGTSTSSSGTTTTSSGTTTTSSSGTTTTSSSGTTTTTQISGLPSGLEAYWKFDEISGSSASDSSGNGHTGSLFGGVTWKPGHTNNAADFPGAGSDYVDVNSFGSFTTFTVAAWINRTGAVYARETLFSYKEMYPTTCGFSLILNLDGSSQHPGIYVALDIKGWQYLEGPDPIPLHQWTHLAATYDGTNIVLYVNGVPVATDPVTGSMTQCSHDIRIGNIESGSLQMEFPGRIDEVQVYTRALSQTEINQVMSYS